MTPANPCRIPILLLVLGLLLSTAADAATVTRSPGSCRSVSAGGEDWSEAGDAISSNNRYAQAKSEDNREPTDYLRCTGYGFSIPVGATINGITVRVERRSSSTANGGSHDYAMRLVRGGAIQATDRSTTTTYTTSDVVEAHGGATDLWGSSWTPADINSADFGAAFRAVKQSSGGHSQTIYVDHLEVTIDYTEGGGSTPGGDCSATASPASCSSVGGAGSIGWWFPGWATASDNWRAAAPTWGRGSYQTEYLYCTGFGFALPSNGTINGITVEVERRLSSTSRASARDAAMRLVRNGAIGTADRSSASAYTTADTYVAHGGSTDLWGTAWTPADINRADFGAALSTLITKTSHGLRSVEVDHLRITVSCTLPGQINPSAFNAYDTATAPADAITGYLTTKIAGQAFDFDIAALDGTLTALLTTYAQTVRVELLDASAGGPLDNSNCNSAWPVLQTLPNQTFTGNANGAGKDRAITGSGGRHRVGGVVVPNAWPNVAVRVSYPATGTPSVVGCSTDHLAIRPAAFAGLQVTDEDWTTPGTRRSLSNLAATGGVTHKAGQPFSVQATAVNAASATTTNYVGTPVAEFSACSGTACTTTFGNFALGAPAVAGAIDVDTATYEEVGAFTLQLQDRSFATVDASDGSPATCDGRYICSGALAIGRFVPDHFAVVAREIINRSDLPVPVTTTTTADVAAGAADLPILDLVGFAVGTRVRIPGGGSAGDSLLATVTAAAASTLSLDTPLAGDLAAGASVHADPGFTYMGEPLDAQFTLIARAAGGTTTSNYDGVLAKLDPLAAGNPLSLALVDNGATRTAFPACGATPAFPCFTPATATGGSFTSGVADDVRVPLTVHRGSTPVGQCAALDVGIAPVDGDGVTMAAYDLDADATAGEDHALVGRSTVRYGRIRLGNGYGSELVPLPIPATIQYWQAAASCATSCGCTSGGYVTSTADSQSGFAAGDVIFSNYRLNLSAGEVSVVTPPASVAFTRGVGGFLLSAPGAGNQGSVELATHVPAYLPGTSALAVFGAYKAPLLFRRENF